MKKTSGYCLAGLICLLVGIDALVPDARAAAGDDFNDIVHHIEAQYHVHRSYPFLTAFVGFVSKSSRFAGVKGFKMALFEDQNLSGSDGDPRLDEIVQSAGRSGWQPLIKSFSRRTGEHNYIYVRGQSKELTMLMVSVEPNEAVVLQVKIDADKLSQFINEHSEESGHRDIGASAHRVATSTASP
jgi:hypothetical protein